MARGKTKRKLTFKPIFKQFEPKDVVPQGVVDLLHEEIEALYHMDVMGLYQEDAAQKMEVSRPTFTRILKGARQKVSKALISGYSIKINDDKSTLFIAVCSDTEDSFNNIEPNQDFIKILKLQNNTLQLEKIILNPVVQEKLKPASSLPSILNQYNVNIFISSKIGAGLKNTLLAKGIRPLKIVKIDSIQSLKDILIQSYI